MRLSLLPTLADYCASLPGEFSQITDDRRQQLQPLSDYLYSKRSPSRPVSMTVICTHNSRRSHMGQLWLQTAATYYGVADVRTYSGGTEATAFHPHAVASLRRAGFDIQTAQQTLNPVYTVRASDDGPAWRAFSKRFNDSTNPDREFAAIMVCTDADQNCPIVPGAETRVSLPYEDPKAYDGTPQEAPQYDRCCRQIAREMFYAMSTAGESH